MITIALAGLGTVGSSVAKALLEDGEGISARVGTRLHLVAVSGRDKSKQRGCDLSRVQWHDDPVKMAALPDVDVVVELIGGAEGVAKEVAETALLNGKHLVTANKALLAKHGMRLAKFAQTKNKGLLFEAAVAGGIPIIKTLRESLVGNDISVVRGILNGTCNFILTKMRAEKWGFDQALAEAQRLGYAEADPTADVDGHDTANKLAILSALAFNTEPDLASVSVEGIRAITPLDIQFADELECRIKLLGVAIGQNGCANLQRVGAALVPLSSPLATVDGAMNAVMVRGNRVGDLALVGQGAGGEATSSAVLSDLIDLGRGAWQKGVLFEGLGSAATGSVSKFTTRSRYYLRLMAMDKPGVVADVAAILRDGNVSIQSLLQHGVGEGNAVPIVITTHAADDTAMRHTAQAIGRLPSMMAPPCLLPIED